MWQVKKFKTQQALNDWQANNSHRYQIDIIYINNGFAVEYKPLRIIDIQ